MKKLSDSYPDAVDPARVGDYPASAFAGGGFVWDEVLEYRVWCHPENGAEDTDDGNDYYYAFATYEDALACSKTTPGADEPLALILQRSTSTNPRTGTTFT